MSIRHAPPSRDGVVAGAPRASRQLERVLAAGAARRDPTPTGGSWQYEAAVAFGQTPGYFVDGTTGRWKYDNAPSPGMEPPKSVQVKGVHISTDCDYWTLLTWWQKHVVFGATSVVGNSDYYRAINSAGDKGGSYKEVDWSDPGTSETVIRGQYNENSEIVNVFSVRQIKRGNFSADEWYIVAKGRCDFDERARPPE